MVDSTYCCYSVAPPTSLPHVFLLFYSKMPIHCILAVLRSKYFYFNWVKQFYNKLTFLEHKHPKTPYTIKVTAVCSSEWQLHPLSLRILATFGQLLMSRWEPKCEEWILSWKCAQRCVLSSAYDSSSCKQWIVVVVCWAGHRWPNGLWCAAAIRELWCTRYK